MTEQHGISNSKCLLKKDGVYNLLKDKIFSQEYTPSYKFPREEEFARQLGVGRITLRTAIKNLEKAGLVKRLNGKGTFVQLLDSDRKHVKQFLALIENNWGNVESPITYLLPSFIKYCEQKDIGTTILPMDILRASPEESILKALQKKDFTAVLVCASDFIGGEKTVRILKALDKPVLLPHSRCSDGAVTGFAAMGNDYRKAWIDGVRHLVSLGHKDIITIGLQGDGMRNLRGFEEKEYLDFLASEGANSDPSLLLFTPFNYPGLTNCLVELFKRSTKPSAIMCFSDFLAMNVYDSLRSLSMRIPHDVAVMGYCGYPGGNMMSPTLSTVDFNYTDIGATAAEFLNKANDWFKNGSSPPQIISPHKVIVRESTIK